MAGIFDNLNEDKANEIRAHAAMHAEAFEYAWAELGNVVVQAKSREEQLLVAAVAALAMFTSDGYRKIAESGK